MATRVDENLADQMLALTELQRDAAPRADTDWPVKGARMITDGDPSLDIHPERLRNHPPGQGILHTTQAALDTCDPSRLRCTAVVHGDLAPRNLLVNDGRISAVITPATTQLHEPLALGRLRTTPRSFLHTTR